jgi:hypothetical protein
VAVRLASRIRTWALQKRGTPRSALRSDKFAVKLTIGIVAGMVTAAAAATAVGFWLSYGGLHAFAWRAGLRGPESWAWPASVDLFIAAGEAGVTISALRRRRDPMAWVYLVLGFGASVTGNVLHVDPAVLHWAKYAVAATPPAAAMLALAALLRHVYRLAVDAHPGQPQDGGPLPKVAADSESAALAAYIASVAGGNPLSGRQLETRFGLTRAQATKVRASLNGSAP